MYFGGNVPILNMDRLTYSHHSPKELWFNNLVFTLGFYNLEIGIDFVEVLSSYVRDLDTWWFLAVLEPYNEGQL